MISRIGVVAPNDIEWIRAAAGALVVDDDIAAAHLVVCAAADAALPSASNKPLVLIDEPADAADSRVAHFIRRGLPVEHLFALLSSLAGRPARIPPLPPPNTSAAARNAQRAFIASRRLAGANRLIDAESTAAAAVAELMSADRAYCLFHDPDDGSLWSEHRMRHQGDRRRAVSGLVGFAAITGMTVAAQRAGQDLRWWPVVDDPCGAPHDRIVAQPILGSDNVVQAVLVAVRDGRRTAFSDIEVDLLARYAALVAPFLDQVSSHHQAEDLIQEAAPDEGLFRPEAIAARDSASYGDIIRVTPSWMSWAYVLFVGLLLGGGVYAWVGTIATYSSGPAVLSGTARTSVVARTVGNVAAVERASGQHVEAGDAIARLDDQAQRAALDRAEGEFASQLRIHMLDPSDSTADSALRRLRQERDEARAALEDRIVRATASGTIADMRVHVGQHVQPGDIVATVSEGVGELEVVAVLPGEHRPELWPGMTARLELSGHRHAYQVFLIDSVSANVIGPSEARRVLGPEIADSLELRGPVVLARGRLARDAFDADGRTFRYHEGMLGTAEVQVSEEPILLGLIPGL